MPGVGVAVVERVVGLGQQRLEDLFPEQHGAHGQVAAADPFAEGHDVRNRVPVLNPEEPSRPAEPGHHFVGDPEHVVAVADLPDPGEVVGRREAHGAGGQDDGIGHEGGHVLRSGPDDGPLQLLDAGEGAGFPASVEDAGAGQAGVDVVEAGEPGAVGLADSGTRGRQGSQGGSVIAGPTGDDLVFLALAPPEVVEPGQFQRGLDSFRAARDEVGVVQAARRLFRQPSGEFGRHGIGEMGGEDERQLPGLVRHDPGDAAASVSENDVAGSRGAVDVAFAGVVVDVDPLASLHHRIVIGGVLEQQGA